MEEKNQVRVNNHVYQKLTELKKKGGTYNNVIESLLNYFDITGIKPTEYNFSPVTIVRDATERSIKILKSVENNRLIPMFLMVERILEILSNENEIPKKAIKGDLKKNFNFEGTDITPEELSEFMELYNLKNEEMKQKDLEIQNLNKKLSEKFNERNLNGNLVESLKEIKKSILDLDEKKKPSSINRDYYQIDKNIYIRNFQTIINVLNTLNT